VIQGAIVVLVVVYAPDGVVGATRAIRRRLQRSAVIPASGPPKAHRPEPSSTQAEVKEVAK
jgi:hypothetical protein